jgi:hypothetical protein
MEQGRIVEEGGYQALLDQRGKLWNYHQMQYETGNRATDPVIVGSASVEP